MRDELARAERRLNAHRRFLSRAAGRQMVLQWRLLAAEKRLELARAAVEGLATQDVTDDPNDPNARKVEAAYENVRAANVSVRGLEQQLTTVRYATADWLTKQVWEEYVEAYRRARERLIEERVRRAEGLRGLWAQQREDKNHDRQSW